MNLNDPATLSPGGTRTTSITGAYVALQMTVNKLPSTGRLKTNPMKDVVAVVSICHARDEILVDLSYIEDSTAYLDRLW